jgi:hypothetical protein
MRFPARSSRSLQLVSGEYTRVSLSYCVVPAGISLQTRLNLARLLNNGSLPPHVIPFMIIFGAFFALVSALKAFSPLTQEDPTLSSSGINSRQSTRNLNKQIQRIIKYLPSGIAFAVGFLNSPSFSLARLIGGYIAFRSARDSATGETPLLAVVVASGFVLGEGVFSIVTLGLTSGGYGAVSCWGCGVGGGGYCSGGCT